MYMTRNPDYEMLMKINRSSPTNDQLSLMYANANANKAPAKVDVASTAPFNTSFLSSESTDSQRG